MSWMIGYDRNWKRDIGYGVPAFCDHSGCNEEIDRGLSYICGADPMGGEYGCGLFFCGKHLYMAGDKRDNKPLCKRCYHGKKTFEAKPDHPTWIKHKLTDPSWQQWREENPDEVKRILMT